MPLGIKPTVDFIFKILFGSEENKDLLIHLLNSVLCLEFPIEEVQLENPFNAKSFEDDKLSVVDVKARDARGRWYLIEVQTTVPTELNNRLVYYTSKLFSDQMREGQSYGDLRPATSICVLAGTLFPHAQSGHLCFELYDARQNVGLSDQFAIHLIQLPQFEIGEEELSTSSLLERWVYLLNRAESLEVDQLCHLLPDSAYQKAAGVLEMISRDPQLRQLYEDRLKEERDRLSLVKDAAAKAREEGLAKGLEEGREKGLEEGREKGLEEGREKGLEEGRERGLQKGREEGLEQGREQGEIFGRIKLLQSLLGEQESSTSELESLSDVQCEELFSVLQERLRSRGI